jgi:hypothetical protein
MPGTQQTHNTYFLNKASNSRGKKEVGIEE